MPRETVIDLGREFSVILESSQDSDGCERMQWTFHTEIRDPQRRANLLTEVLHALNEAFTDSGISRFVRYPGGLERQMEENIQSRATAAMLEWRFGLIETPLPDGTAIRYGLSGGGTNWSVLTRPVLPPDRSNDNGAILRYFNDFKRCLKNELKHNNSF